MSICGWLAPNGKFHSCNSYEHGCAAFDLDKLYYNNGDRKEEDFQEILYAKGFIKFTRDDVFMFSCILEKRIEPSDKQIAFILENKDISKYQHSKIAYNMRINSEMPLNTVFSGDNNLTECVELRIMHTMDEYSVPTKFIKITANVPVAKEVRPILGEVYPVIKEGGEYGLLYFILVNGEEVGIYPVRECEVMQKS